MACTIEKVLSDARMLVSRLREHDSAADCLISQTTSLNKRVDAMKCYQDNLNELNDIARHRPRSALIMNLAQENSQIRELQAENKDLRLALDEHQSALELIMSKYREQVLKLVVANKLDRSSTSSSVIENPAQSRDKIDRISEMVVVMQRAIRADDDSVAQEQQVLQQLKLENKTLRELLHITVNSAQFCNTEQAETNTQTDDTGDATADVDQANNERQQASAGGDDDGQDSLNASSSDSDNLENSPNCSVVEKDPKSKKGSDSEESSGETDTMKRVKKK